MSVEKPLQKKQLAAWEAPQEEVRLAVICYTKAFCSIPYLHAILSLPLLFSMSTCSCLTKCTQCVHGKIIVFLLQILVIVLYLLYGFQLGYTPTQ